MGCGCKGGKTTNLEKGKINSDGELTLKGKLLKIPTIIILTILMTIMSPIIMIIIWVFAMKSVLGFDNDLAKMLLLKYKKNVDLDDELEEINPDDYELDNVEIIK